jgi:lysophospholipase L1-like esterase
LSDDLRVRFVGAGELLVRLLGFAVLVVLSAGFAACSQGMENDARSKGESPRSGMVHQATTDATQRDTEDGTGTSPPDDADTWDYVALGDSLAAGVGARRGYVDRYADHLREDTGARIELTNLGVSGQTSPQLLRSLRNDPSTRRALRGAEVVTYNIGINDLGQARGYYEAGTCGGAQGERCLHTTVRELDQNWDEITEEILSLSSPDETIIRTVGLGYTPHAGRAIEPYLKQLNRNIATSADESNIPYAEVSLSKEGLGPDGLHPDESGYEEIADGLEELGVGN